MAVDRSGCLICDLLNATMIAYHEANSNRIAALRLQRFQLEGLNLTHVEEAKDRAKRIGKDLATLGRHPCKGSYRLKG